MAAIIKVVLVTLCLASSSSGQQLQSQAPDLSTVKVVLRTQQNSDLKWISTVGVNEEAADYWGLKITQTAEECPCNSGFPVLETEFALSTLPPTSGTPSDSSSAVDVPISICPSCPPPPTCPTCPPSPISLTWHNRPLSPLSPNLPTCNSCCPLSPKCPTCPSCPLSSNCPTCFSCPLAPNCPTCYTCPLPTACQSCPPSPPSQTCPTCPTCPTTTTTSKSAPPGYERFIGVGYYKVSSQAETWLNARNICEQDGGHLLILNSQTEADAIKTLMNHFPSIPGSTNDGFVFLGAQRIGTKFITVLGDDLVNTGYVRWAPNEPSGGSEFCLSLARSNDLLNDVTCTKKLGFICEHLNKA